jgi:hypothetical protein
MQGRDAGQYQLCICSEVSKHVCWPNAEGANLYALVQCNRSNLEHQVTMLVLLNWPKYC